MGSLELRALTRRYSPPMDEAATGELERIIDAWGAIDFAFATVEDHPWGAVVADPRYPAVLQCNMARVSARTPVRLAIVEDALRSVAPHAPKSSVVVFHPEEQTELLAEMGSIGGLFFDDVLVARDPTPAAEDRRVEVADPSDDSFWRGLSTTHEVAFGISDARVREQLAAIEREVLIPKGKRWFVVRGDDGEVEAMAAVFPGAEAAEIDHVATVPAARRRGHASALVARCVTEARAAGTETVFLLAEPDSHAEALYRRLGFTRVTTFGGWVSPPRR